MSASADLLYTDIEDELRASVRALLADRCAPAAVFARCEGDEPYDRGLWRMLAAELGCAGLAVPESAGGAGASFREAAVVAEELGAAVAPVPFLGSAGLATAALLSCGETDLLAELAAGRRTAAFVVPLSTPPGAPFPSSVRAGAKGAGVVSGTVANVADALPADDLVVPGRDGDQPALFVVEASRADCVPVVSLDLTRRLADITFDGAPVRRVAVGPAAEQAYLAALRTGAALLANEQLGVANRCLTMTVDYVKGRYQFARPVGSFQGLKHRLADLWVAITQARAAARYAAVCVATGDPDADVAVAVAQAYCSQVAVWAAEECVQMHGGIGFTWEHPAHLYLKRAKSSAIALGTADRHRATLATLVDLPGPLG